MEKMKRGELLIAGVGGWGIVTIGNMMADAALKAYENVAWFPSYATMMRGGDSDCCVIFSHDRISSPLIFQSSAVMVLGAIRIPAFENRVKPGGLMLIESSGVNDENKVKRDDIDVRYVSVMEEANKLGSIKNANLVMLGVYIKATDLLSKQLIIDQIETRFGGPGKEERVKTSKEAFLAGTELKPISI
ncbi:MAG: 2-oxoacid:acceptor oxidoreductase family protein [Spirochaetota bacterium]|nr:2-oxoacid:acceptor oxidoreductase family protein [Spirochaetota bacterium]